MNSSELRRASNDESRRLSTLLLGFAATAIAFAFHETSEWKPSAALYVIAAAVGCWALSFISGIMWAHAAQEAMLLNAADMEIPHGHSLRAEVDRKLLRAQRRTSRRYICQLATLGIGAALYACGFGLHVHQEQEDPQTVLLSAPARAK